MTAVLMVMIIIAAAAFIKSAIGVAVAVLALPLLSHWVGIRAAVPLIGKKTLTLQPRWFKLWLHFATIYGKAAMTQFQTPIAVDTRTNRFWWWQAYR